MKNIVLNFQALDVEMENLMYFKLQNNLHIFVILRNVVKPKL